MDRKKLNGLLLNVKLDNSFINKKQHTMANFRKICVGRVEELKVLVMFVLLGFGSSYWYLSRGNF